MPNIWPPLGSYHIHLTLYMPPLGHNISFLFPISRAPPITYQNFWLWIISKPCSNHIKPSNIYLELPNINPTRCSTEEFTKFPTPVGNHTSTCWHLNLSRPKWQPHEDMNPPAFLKRWYSTLAYDILCDSKSRII